MCILWACHAMPLPIPKNHVLGAVWSLEFMKQAMDEDIHMLEYNINAHVFAYHNTLYKILFPLIGL